MKVAISGITGYIGKNLSRHLEKCDELIPIDRYVFSLNSNEFTRIINRADAIVNLAGKNINIPWTKKNRKEIIESRVNTTKKIREALELSKKKVKLINASAVGIYDEFDKHDEQSNKYNEDFLGEVVKEWEKNIWEIKNENIMKSVIRLGVVLGKESAFIKNVVPIYKKGLGGKLGRGKQYFPFIHIDDVVGGIKFLLNNEKNNEIYNFVAPGKATNKEFNDSLNDVLNKRGFLPVPATILRVRYGKRADMLLKGQNIEPNGLLKDGYTFEYKDIDEALMQIIKN